MSLTRPGWAEPKQGFEAAANSRDARQRWSSLRSRDVRVHRAESEWGSFLTSSGLRSASSSPGISPSAPPSTPMASRVLRGSPRPATSTSYDLSRRSSGCDRAPCPSSRCRPRHRQPEAVADRYPPRRQPRPAQADLDEFVFRYNRRKKPIAACPTLLGLGSGRTPIPYRRIRGASDLAKSYDR